MPIVEEITSRAKLWCRYCEQNVEHRFSHSQVLKERRKDISGTFVEYSKDLWYKCQGCMTVRRWGHEHVPTEERAR